MALKKARQKAKSVAKKAKKAEQRVRRFGSSVQANQQFSVKVKPSQVAIGVGVGLIGAYLLYDLGRTRGPAKTSEEDFGAVHPRMGGRGRGAGRGVATNLGGRGPKSPYEYETPSMW